MTVVAPATDIEMMGSKSKSELLGRGWSEGLGVGRASCFYTVCLGVVTL